MLANGTSLGGRISGLLLTTAAKASSLIITAKCLGALLFAMLLSFCALVNRVTRGILSSFADHWPAPPGPEKSRVQIYRSTVDWLPHICTPINTFTVLLMPPLGINKVRQDSAKNQAAQGRARRNYCVREEKGNQWLCGWKERCILTWQVLQAPIHDREKLLHPLDTIKYSQQKWDTQIILFLYVPSIRVLT